MEPLTNLIDINNVEQYKFLSHGSTRDAREIAAVTDEKPGRVLFDFTDHTSTDDYGRLGPEWETKGKAEAMVAVAMASTQGIVERFGENSIRPAVLGGEGRIIVAEGYRKIDPDKVDDFSQFRTNVMVPWEVIVRNIVTGTSSAARRTKKPEDDPQFLHYSRLGLSSMPTEFPVILPVPFFDGSTKMRKPEDQYLSWQGLQEYAPLDSAVAAEIARVANTVNVFMLERGAKTGFLINDYKIELALDENGRVVVCEMPTFDEVTTAYVGAPYTDMREFQGKLRIFQPGKVHDLGAFMNVSKQPYRDETRSHTEWNSLINKEKEEVVQGIRKQGDYTPPPSPNPGFIDLMVAMQAEAANQWITGKSDLGNVAAEYKRWAASTYTLKK